MKTMLHFINEPCFIQNVKCQNNTNLNILIYKFIKLNMITNTFFFQLTYTIVLSYKINKKNKYISSDFMIQVSLVI